MHASIDIDKDIDVSRSGSILLRQAPNYSTHHCTRSMRTSMVEASMSLNATSMKGWMDLCETNDDLRERRDLFGGGGGSPLGIALIF